MWERARIGFVVVLGVAAAGCANYSQLQDAETLPRGSQSLGVGVSFSRYENDIDENGTNESVSVPAVVITARRNLADRLEGQATAWIPLGARAGLKYQLVGEPGATGLHVSLGGMVGYLSLSATSDDGDSEASVNFLDLYAPLYVGMRVSPSFEVYGAPQYIYRSVWGTDSGDRLTAHVTGGTLGVAIGRRSKVFIEGGAFYDTLYEAAIFNTAIGVGL